MKISILLPLFLFVFFNSYSDLTFSCIPVTDTLVHQQPVIPGDLADPTVIRVGNTYYASGTSSEWAPHYPLFKSDDLLHWQQLGYVFPQTPAWASSSFWAPELFYLNDTYYVYYVARKKSDGMSCIGVATAKDPAKGFTDHGILLEFGKECIDPFVLQDSGKLYMSFKAYGLETRPIELLCCQLSADGLSVQGEPFSLLRDDAGVGLEGQCMLKKNNYYYLFYSEGDCCGRGCTYRVNVARSAGIKGPYTKFDENPVIAANAEWKCPGHGTIVTTPQAEDYYLYHAYNTHDNVYTGRQGMLSKLIWNTTTGWPSAEAVSGPVEKGFKDGFLTDSLNVNWQWDFRHSQPVTTIKKGILYLSGKTTAGNNSGTALTVRPYNGNYEISTAVVNSNASLKGLVVYGDASQAAGIGVKKDSVEVWQVKDSTKTVLEAKAIKPGVTYLKIVVEDGYKFKFYAGSDAGNWSEITTGDAFYNADFLPPWDRSPRPGLLQQGSEPAAFDFFEIKYY